jgi:hypothetical protein
MALLSRHDPLQDPQLGGLVGLGRAAHSLERAGQRVLTRHLAPVLLPLSFRSEPRVLGQQVVVPAQLLGRLDADLLVLNAGSR